MSVTYKYKNNDDIICACCDAVCGNGNIPNSKVCNIHKRCRKVLLEKDKAYLIKLLDEYIKRHTDEIPINLFENGEYSSIIRLGSNDYYVIPKDNSLMFELEDIFNDDVKINNIINYILNIL